MVVAPVGEVDEGLLSLAGAEPEWLPPSSGPVSVAGHAATMIRGAVVGPGTGDNMGAALAWDFGSETWRSPSARVAPCSRRRDTVNDDPRGEVAGFADAAGRFSRSCALSTPPK